MKILLVDDDLDIVDNNAEYLAKKGYDTLKAYDGASALALANEADLIILDVGLPDTNGFALAEKLTSIKSVPILFLTARSDESALEQSFRLGCDYMKKPYSIKELHMRIDSILARQVDIPFINVPPFSVNISAMSLTANSKTILLTPTEFALFMMLLKNRDKTVGYERLYETVWGNGDVSVSVVAQHIISLRRKIENEIGLKCIKTVRGVGYYLNGDDYA